MSTSSLRLAAKRPNSLMLAAWRDIVGGLFKFELWGRMGWQDVKRRYRRTVIGPFWNTATLSIYILGVGMVGAGLFHQDIHQYLTYLFSGMIVWTLISTIVLESCTLFVTGHVVFRSVRFEYSVLVYALVWRNFILFLHNLIVYLAVALALQPQLIRYTLLLTLPGLFIVLLNGLWLALVLGMICLRFRDVPPLVQTATQILMLTTPIFWSADNLTGLRRFIFVQLNPVYSLIDVVRAPLLGSAPAEASYAAALAIAAVGWLLTFLMFSHFRKRIAYWS